MMFDRKRIERAVELTKGAMPTELVQPSNPPLRVTVLPTVEFSVLLEAAEALLLMTFPSD